MRPVTANRGAFMVERDIENQSDNIIKLDWNSKSDEDGCLRILESINRTFTMQDSDIEALSLCNERAQNASADLYG